VLFFYFHFVFNTFKTKMTALCFGVKGMNAFAPTTFVFRMGVCAYGYIHGYARTPTKKIIWRSNSEPKQASCSQTVSLWCHLANASEKLDGLATAIPRFAKLLFFFKFYVASYSQTRLRFLFKDMLQDKLQKLKRVDTNRKVTTNLEQIKASGIWA